jgi:hypothetical protein
MKSTWYAPLLFWVAFATVAPLQAHSSSDNLIRSAHEKKLAEHPYWRRLLHMRIGWFGRTLSDIDGKNFFLSPQGRTNPRAELDATLRAFLEPISTDAEVQHPQCRFPERYHWLKGQLNFSPLKACRFSSVPGTDKTGRRAKSFPSRSTIRVSTYFSVVWGFGQLGQACLLWTSGLAEAVLPQPSQR